ncbi:extracellular solute-binding protein [Isoptericola sp. NPDC019482]|uniref:extracellular solute-binding protein n=1 Tax=Isoptericola sp. NPDC019482 TaxID=3154688 RepID=UPI003477A1F1
MRTRRLAPLALLAVGSLALTACGSGGSGDGGDGGGGEALDSLSIMAPYFSTTPPADDDPVGAKLSELAGLDLDMQWVPNAEYGDRTNVVLAGDEIPDVMVIQQKSQGFVQTAEAGGFWDLTEYLASGDYPNLVTENPDVQQASSVNGKVYGVYRARDVVRTSITIRKDWLKNLGLEEPTNTDELMALAKAFTEDDPDGNGKDDTYGMIIPAWGASIGTGSPYDAIETWFGAGNVWKDEGGKLIPSFTTPEWKQALDYEKQLIDNGYVNKDYATMDGSTQWNEPFLNGKGGIIIDVQSRASQLAGLFKDKDPKTYDQFVALQGNIAGPNGDFALPTPGYSGFLAVPKASVQTEEQLKQVLTALNELSSTEGQILENNGIEGDNFTVEDGFVVNDESKQDYTDLVSGSWAQIGTNVAGYEAYKPKPETEYDAELEKERADLQAKDLEKAVFNPGAALVSETYMTNGVQLDQVIADARIQYISGQIDEAGLDAAIAQWKSSGGDAVTAEMNELYGQLG